jgi:hypothetical protein
MISKQTKIILAAAAIIFVLVAATVTEFYLETTQSASKPFSFSLTANPDNAAVVQGGNATITVEATYLNGTSKPLTLSASGGPNGTTYTFLTQTLAPTRGNPLSSNLTINLPNANVSRTYAINITATTPDGMTNSTTCTLTVLNNEILIKGTVTANRWSGVYPTKIEFINVNTDQIYWVPLNTTAGSQTGTYSLIVPNHQLYEIICWCKFTPESGHGSARGFEPMWFTVDCGTGVTTLTKDFTDKDAALV